jgi:hypothetical protein
MRWKVIQHAQGDEKCIKIIIRKYQRKIIIERSKRRIDNNIKMGLT